MSPFALLIMGPALAAFAARSTLPALRWVAVGTAAGSLALVLAATPTVTAGEVWAAAFEWLPALGVEVAFRLDGWSFLFALLITGIGLAVLLYSRAYMSAPDRRRLEPLLLLFMAAMLAAVLADDLVTLYVAWELTGITSFGLIGFHHERPEARAAAQQALIVTAAGGLAMLAGFILLAITAGTWRISELGPLAGSGVTATAIVALVLTGAMTKSAQFPVHGWLPAAMAAPTPVSAYLHSATMVKLGVYLLGRLAPALSAVALWSVAIPVVGAVTLVVGGVLAIREDDLKRVLAYSTVSALGALFVLVGLGTAAAAQAAAVFLLAHAAYKAALFLVVGGIDHESGTRSLARLSGLGRAMPWTWVAAAAAAASLAGLPPTLGFLAKETLAYAADGAAARAWLLPAVVAGAALQVVAAGLVALAPFTGARMAPARPVHDGSPLLWLPPLVLGAIGSVGTIALILRPSVVEAAASAIAGRSLDVSLSLVPHSAMVLAVSVIALAAGAAAYRARSRFAGVPWPLPTAEQLHAWSLGALTAFGARLTGLIQTGSLSGYLVIALLAAAIPALVLGIPAAALPSPTLDFVGLDEVIVPLLIAVAAIAAASSRTRLRAIIALGASGYAVALLFAQYGAPDLAMTQVLIETLTVVLLVSAFRFLPVQPTRLGRLIRLGDAVVAGAVAVAMTVLTWSVTVTAVPDPVSGFFAASSYPLAHGRNVVNTILVDFRAVDTLGEIIVLAAASIGVLALLPDGPSSSARRTRAPSLVLRTGTRFLMSLLLVLSFFLLLRGHNEPGGGFIAGLVTTAAIVLYAMAYGVTSARRLLPIDPRQLVAGGLAIALASGLIGVLAGDGPMAGQWIQLGTDGSALKLGTPLLFDLGVFSVVIGAATGIVLTLAEAQ